MTRLADLIRDAAWTQGNQLRMGEIAERLADAVRDELAPTDDEIRALVKSVAQATAEFVAESYDCPAELWAERKQVAEEMARQTMACADEDPDSEVHAMRRMRT